MEKNIGYERTTDALNWLHEVAEYRIVIRKVSAINGNTETIDMTLKDMPVKNIQRIKEALL